MSRRWSRPTRSIAAVAAALAITAALGACSGDDDEDADSSSTTTTTATKTSASTTTSSGADGTTTTASGGGSDKSTTTSAPPAGDDSSTEGVIVLTIAGGNVEGGVRRETVKQGSQVTIRATSDTADELHVHGYDLKTELVPGQSADLTFLAKIPGVFEVELEDHGKKVLELEVRP